MKFVNEDFDLTTIPPGNFLDYQESVKTVEELLSLEEADIYHIRRVEELDRMVICTDRDTWRLVPVVTFYDPVSSLEKQLEKLDFLIENAKFPIQDSETGLVRFWTIEQFWNKNKMSE